MLFWLNSKALHYTMLLHFSFPGWCGRSVCFGIVHYHVGSPSYLTWLPYQNIKAISELHTFCGYFGLSS